MHYPFTTEQLLELIEFVARAIMFQARPSGDDNIVGRQALLGQPPSLRTCLLTHRGLRLHPSLLRSGPVGAGKLTSAAHPNIEDSPIHK